MSDVLIVIGPAASPVKKADLAAVGFGLEAAEKSGGDCDVLCIGSPTTAREIAKLGVRKVTTLEHADLESYTAEAYAAAVAAFIGDSEPPRYRLIGASTSSASRETFPRLAAMIDAPMASDVIAIEAVDPERAAFTRAVFVGNLLARVELSSALAVVTCRASEFPVPPEAGGEGEVDVVRLEDPVALPGKRFVASRQQSSERPDLSEADIIVSAGRGTKGPDKGIPIVEELADLLGASVGATRAVVDAEWLPNELQVGQTGKIVAPKLYIAVGISGAIQHLAGMRNSKTIVAINKDPDAPIFEVADLGLVADLFEAVPDMIEEIRKIEAS